MPYDTTRGPPQGGLAFYKLTQPPATGSGTIMLRMLKPDPMPAADRPSANR